MNQKNQKFGILFLGVVILTWGANVGIIKSAYKDFHPLLFAAIRFTLSGVLLLAATFWREGGLALQREDLGKVVLVGGLGVGLYQILWSLGLNLTSASNSALILSTAPLLGALYVDLKKEEPVGRREYGGMLLALAGVVLVILRPTVRLEFSLDTLIGDLLTLMASFCWAIIFSVGSKPLLKTYSPLRLMGYCMVIGAVVLWGGALMTAPKFIWEDVGGKAWCALGYAVVFSGILGHVFWYEGINRVGVTKTLISSYFIPLWAVLFNTLLMGEKIFLQQVFGGVLILLGVHYALRK